ncbi:hypothetical protein CWC38_03715 [Kocuria tytonicola]|nr:hypothetical protein CWC38_03715 [Kocuria tytonicola]
MQAFCRRPARPGDWDASTSEGSTPPLYGARPRAGPGCRTPGRTRCATASLVGWSACGLSANPVRPSRAAAPVACGGSRGPRPTAPARLRSARATPVAWRRRGLRHRRFPGPGAPSPGGRSTSDMGTGARTCMGMVRVACEFRGLGGGCMSLGEARNPVGSRSSLLRAVMGRDVSPRPHHPWWVPYRRLALLCDVLAVGTAMVVATTLRPDGAASVAETGVAWLSPPFLATLIGASWILALVVCGAYSHALLGIGGDEYRRVAHAAFMLGGVLSAVAVLMRMDVARGFLFTALSLGVVLLLVGRRGMRQVLVRMRRGGAMIEDSLLIGSRAGVTWAAERIRATPAAGYRVSAIACAEPDAPGALALADGTVVCNLRHWDRLPQLLDETGLRTVIVADDVHTDRALLRHLSERVGDFDAQLVLTNQLADVLGPRAHLRPVQGLPLMAGVSRVSALEARLPERWSNRAGTPRELGGPDAAGVVCGRALVPLRAGQRPAGTVPREKWSRRVAPWLCSGVRAWSSPGGGP